MPLPRLPLVAAVPRTIVPFTEEHPEKSKRGIYAIGDPFVAFWCRSILPLGVDVLRELSRMAATLPVPAGRGVELALFPLSGFTEEPKAAAKQGDVTLVWGAGLLQVR